LALNCPTKFPVKTKIKSKVDFAGAFENEIKRKGSSIFPLDFDEANYGFFNKYKKPRQAGTGGKLDVYNKRKKRITINSPYCVLIKDSIERTNRHIQNDPTFLKRWPKFKNPKYIRQYVIDQIAEQKRELKEAAKKRANKIAAILDGIESSYYYNHLGIRDQSNVRANIRDVVLEYLKEAAVFIPTSFNIDADKIPVDGIPDDWPRVNAIHVPEGYTLSGANAGDYYALKKENISAIVNEALFWKSRKMLGLLWTIADHGEKGALLKIAKTLVPFVKALNGKLIAQPDLLGLWPQSLPSWPVTKSLHPLYDSEHESLLRELHVGDTLPMRVDGGARWELDIIAKCALYLYEEIERRRRWLCDDSDLPEDLKIRLSDLKKFSSENWEAWWNLAEDLLDYGYVDLVDIPELKKMGHIAQRPQNKRSLARVACHIRKIIATR
jgi:hypothetical protein